MTTRTVSLTVSALPLALVAVKLVGVKMNPVAVATGLVPAGTNSWLSVLPLSYVKPAVVPLETAQGIGAACVDATPRKARLATAASNFVIRIFFSRIHHGSFAK